MGAPRVDNNRTELRVICARAPARLRRVVVVVVVIRVYGLWAAWRMEFAVCVCV